MTTRRSAQSAHQKRVAFLDHFRVSGNVSAACRASHLPRRTVYDWLAAAEPSDELRLFQQAYTEAEVEALEHLEEEAFRRATGYRL
jgi:hypothetical protein